MRALKAFFAVTLVVVLSGCGYNEMQGRTKASRPPGREVVNQYQRRADLIPNLVNTVKGDANRGSRRADARHRGARQVRRRSRPRPSSSTIPAAYAELPAGARRSDERAVAAAGRGRELSEPQVRRGCSANCSRSSRARRTASGVARKRYIKTVQDVQHARAHVPDQPDGDGVRHERQAASSRSRTRPRSSKPPTVDFGTKK